MAPESVHDNTASSDDGIQVCCQLVSGGQVTALMAHSDQTNKPEMVLGDVIDPPEPGNVTGHRVRRMALHRPGLWPNGMVLKVRILSEDEFVVREIKRYASQWSDEANVQFDFVREGDAHIRIAGEPNKYWSYVGTAALDFTQDQPTMNLGFDANTDHTQIRRHVLHEFGHALGAQHEHQTTGENQLNFDRNATCRYYTDLGHSAESVRINYLEKINDADHDTTAFDDLSIMLYQIPPQLIEDRRVLGWNTELSQNDKIAISIAYPRTANSIWSFPWNSKFPHTETYELEHQTARPQLAVCLVALRLENLSDAEDLRVEATVSSTTHSQVDLVISSDAEQGLVIASMLRVSSQDRTFQLGIVNWTDAMSNEVQVNFPRAFKIAPAVFLAIAGFKTIGAPYVAVELVPFLNRPESFKLKVRTSEDPSRILRECSIQWVAYLPDRDGIIAGDFHAEGAGSGNVRLNTRFARAPRLLSGITTLDMKSRTDDFLVTVEGVKDGQGGDWVLDQDSRDCSASWSVETKWEPSMGTFPSLSRKWALVSRALCAAAQPLRHSRSGTAAQPQMHVPAAGYPLSPADFVRPSASGALNPLPQSASSAGCSASAAPWEAVGQFLKR
ncbi:peptidase M12A family, partial [Rhizoctonia solani]